MNTYGYGVPPGVPLVAPACAYGGCKCAYGECKCAYGGCGVPGGCPSCPSYGAANGATGWSVTTKAAVLVALVLLVAYAPKTP